MSSVPGWIVYARAHPLSAITLLRLRIFFTLTRKVIGSWTDPFGLVVNTPEMLVSYWSLFIMRDLHHSSWVKMIRVSASPYVIDVGANAGVFVHYIHTLNRNAEILAVEPQECLTRTIMKYSMRQHPRIRCVTAACSDHSGMTDLYINEDGDTSASIQAQYSVPHTRSLRVPLVTLDQIASPKPVLLLKIDAEGHDIAVLLGGRNLLQRTRYLLLELHNPSDVPNALHILGEGWKTLALGPIDYLFANHHFGKED